MKKLIFFDIDGTIITEGNNSEDRIIPQSLPLTINELRRQGHLCFINTGRSYAEVDKDIRSLPFDGYICGCGTYILYQGKELFSKHLSYKERNRLIQDMKIHHLEWLLEGCHSVYYSTSPYRTHIGDFKREHQIIIPDAYREISPDHAQNLDFDKFCICVDENSDLDGFRRKHEETLTFIDRGNGFFEVMPKGCSKASGIRFLEEYFQIPHKDTIAIGDSTNDLPMLDYAAYSIAMGNSYTELFERVDYVTDTVIEDGVYKAMKHLELI